MLSTIIVSLLLSCLAEGPIAEGQHPCSIMAACTIIIDMPLAHWQALQITVHRL